MMRHKKIKRERHAGLQWYSVGIIAACILFTHCSANVTKDAQFHTYQVTFMNETTFEDNILIALSDSLDRSYLVLSPSQADSLTSEMDSLIWGKWYNLKIEPSTTKSIRMKDYGITIRGHGPDNDFYIGKTIVWSKDTLRVPVYRSENIHGVFVERSRVVER